MPIVIGRRFGVDCGRDFEASARLCAANANSARSCKDRADAVDRLLKAAAAARSRASLTVSPVRPERWLLLVDGEAGNARLSTLSSAWFCQKQTAKAITSAMTQMISLLRSSSRG